MLKDVSAEFQRDCLAFGTRPARAWPVFKALRSGGQGAVAGTGATPYHLWVSKTAGKTSVVKTLMSNRAVRKIVVKNARVAINSATTAIAARSAARSGGSGPPGTATPSRKPAPGALDTTAVKSIVTSVAKPVAEKMATTQTGRSVLETLNNISGEALGTRKRSENPLNAFVTKVAGAAASARTDVSTAQSEKATVKFTPLRPIAEPGAGPVETLRWPPPKLPSEAAAANPSDTGSAPE